MSHVANSPVRPSLAHRALPPLLRAFWVRAFRPPEGRRIVEVRVPGVSRPVRAYIHPRSHLGYEILTTGRYEPETEDMLCRELKPGSVFLDIGGNEGFLSALGGMVVGDHGMVISVEPQSRLQPLIEINLRLNDVRRFRVLHRAIGTSSDGTAEINLYPETNSGQSGLVKRPKFGWTVLKQEHEQVRFITPADALREGGVERVDLAKVDVEGFEHRVVEAMLPLLREGRVRTLLLDYHAPVLRAQGVEPRSIHESLQTAGMRVDGPEPTEFQSYVLYRHAGGAR